MIKALIYNGENSTAVDLPKDRFNLQYELAQIGIREQLNRIPIDDDENRMIHIKLVSDSDFGNCMAKLFTAKHSLDDANMCAHMAEKARMEIKEELEQNLLYEQYSSPQELMDDIRKMTEELVTVEVNYYCPLMVQMNDDDYGDLFEVENGYAVANEDSIKEALQKEQNDDLNNMADYFDGSESAKEKLISAVWDVENVGGELFGVIHTKLCEAFTPAEEQEWIEELTGQASDGFGEGFEQREISTDDGDMYVSFWNSGDEYFMENESDFQIRQMNEQQFGGM